MDTQNSAQQELSQFFKGSGLCAFKKGEIILRAADTPQGAYLLDQGHVKVYSLTDGGEENLHVIYKPGELFPLVWLFKDLVRNVFYEAIDDVKAWRAPKEDLIKLVRSNASLAYLLLQQTVDQFYIYSDRVDNLEYTSAYERVVYRLLFLGGRFGKQVGRSIVIDAPITHQHVASSINLSRETVSREMESLQRKGLVKLEHHRIVLQNIDLLQAQIGEPTSLNLWGLK